MKSKIICAILTASISLSMISIPAFAEGPVIFDMPTINMTEKNKDSRQCHENYPKLISAMMMLIKQNVISKADLDKVHTYYQELQAKDPNALPTTDIGLLDALLKANIVTKAQYDQLVPMLK
ncbi:hypothetical protein [Clostridium sp.]|uniref:hypothetical protein n=1 Tax=Clostridium sp. TaxID=1506 RepID=UPI0032171F4C